MSVDRHPRAILRSWVAAGKARLRPLGKSVLLHAPVVGAPLRQRDQLLGERDRLPRQRDDLPLVGQRSERDLLVGRPSELDRSLYPFPLAYKPKIAYHEGLFPYLATFANDKSVRVLEVGSREVVSASVWKHFIPNCDYVGFDVLAGNNVDVVGDAHRLSEYFEPESFDVVIALAVFEHLAMPWLVAEEITKVLKPAGLVLVETHFSYGAHELPWHFFQFNKGALECLFNQGLGYEIIDSGVDNPMVGRFSFDASEYLKGRPVDNLYCHSSVIARKVGPTVPTTATDLWRASYPEFVQGSMYPPPAGSEASPVEEE